MEQENFLNRLEESYAEKGIIPFDINNKNVNINNKYLIVPNNLTDIPQIEIGEYLNAFTQQKLYARTLLSRIEIQLELSKRRYTEEYDKEYMLLINNKTYTTEKAKEKVVNMNESVRSLMYEYSDWKQKSSYMKNYIQDLDDVIFLLSREITRRGMDYMQENTSLNRR